MNKLLVQYYFILYYVIIMKKLLLSATAITMLASSTFAMNAMMMKSTNMEMTNTNMEMTKAPMKTMTTMKTQMNVEWGVYKDYVYGNVTSAIRAGKTAIIFFYSDQSDTAVQLDADIAAKWNTIPDDVVIIKARVDTEANLRRLYNVKLKGGIIVVSPQGKILARKGWLTKLDEVLWTANKMPIMMEQTMMNDKPMMIDDTPTITMMRREKTVMVGGSAMYPSKDIVSNVVNASNLTTLVAAVKAAGLVETLQSDGPFTVFGPDNNAFAKLPAGTVETLVQPENKDTLVKILTYHVVSGKYDSKALVNGQVLTTVQGGKLTVTKANGKVMLTDENGGISTVITADVYQKNGVAHVIDTVLMPK